VCPGEVDSLSFGIIDQAGTARPQEQRVAIDEEVVLLVVWAWNASFLGVDQVKGWVAADKWQLLDVHPSDATI
jgi:hypothetical protein